MSDHFFKDNSIDPEEDRTESSNIIADRLPNDNDAPAKNPDRSTDAPLFAMQAKVSDAFNDDSLTHLLNKYSADDLKRQSDRLSALYDEPEAADYSPIVFDDQEPAQELQPDMEGSAEAVADSAQPAGEPATVQPAAEEPAEHTSTEHAEQPDAAQPVADSAEPSADSADPAAEEPVNSEPPEVNNVADPAAEEPVNSEPSEESHSAEPDFVLSEGAPVSWYRMIPIILAAAVVPLIVQLKIYTLPLSGYFWTALTDDSPIYDYYSWYKMIAVLGIAALCVVLLAIDVILKKQRFRMSFAYIPAAVFAITAAASFAANGFKEFTIFGWPGRLEGTLSLLAYMIILCYTVITIDTVKSARAVCGAFCLFLAIFTITGMLQFAGFDPLATQTALKITGAFEGVSDAMPGLIPTQTSVHQTFGDPSASAMILCLGIPAAAMLYTQSDYRGKWIRWLKAPLILILIWLCFINAVGIKSAAVLPGLAAALVSGLIVFHRNLKYWTKPILLMLASLALVLTVTYRTWMPELQRLVPAAFPSAQSDAPAQSARPALASVTTDTDSVTFVLKGSNMVLDLRTEADGGSIVKVTPFDGVGHALTLAESDDPGVYLINEEPYHSAFKLCIIKLNNALALRVSMPQKDWDFVSEDGEIRFVSGTGSTVRLYEPVRCGLAVDPAFADCTGAVWNSALPMLKDTILLGRGADSFCLYYPHMDYAAAYNAGLDTAPSEEGPRSALINTAFGTGWISAAALAAIYLVYIVQSVIIFWRRKLSHPLAYAGAGIFLGTVGFLAASLVSDTSVCSMPPFLVLLGTGIAINRIIRGGK